MPTMGPVAAASRVPIRLGYISTSLETFADEREVRALHLLVGFGQLAPCCGAQLLVCHGHSRRMDGLVIRHGRAGDHDKKNTVS